MKLTPRSMIKKDTKPGIDILKSGDRYQDQQFQNLKERMIALENSSN